MTRQPGTRLTHRAVPTSPKESRYRGPVRLPGYRDQDYNPAAARVYSSMMMIAVVSLAVPSAFRRFFSSAETIRQESLLNVGLAVVLLIAYALYLVFMLKIHPGAFAAEGGHGAVTWYCGRGGAWQGESRRSRAWRRLARAMKTGTQQTALRAMPVLVCIATAILAAELVWPQRKPFTATWAPLQMPATMTGTSVTTP